MTIKERTEAYMRRMNAFNKVLGAIEDCRDNWTIEYYQTQLEESGISEERKNDLLERIAEAEKTNAEYDAIAEMVYQLMTGTRK